MKKNDGLPRETLLSNLGIKNLNSMQEETILKIQDNNKLILLSETGSGKTLAFLLPIIESLDYELKQIQALIMVPSRELAIQIESVLKKMQIGVKTTACYGGHKREIEENNLIQPPAILIGTAGRMADHIRRNNVTLKYVRMLVLDEFDKILELGFHEEMRFILESLPELEKKMLTSATFATALPDFVNMDDAHTLNFLTGETKDPAVLRIFTVQSPEADKLQTLLKLLCALKDTHTVVFCNHREAVERTHHFLSEQGIINVFYHGGMEQQDRETALCKFRNASANILITTDLASRGLDVPNIRGIIHYHLPLTEEAFTHRNGRTARMETTGNVYLIIGVDEKTPAYVADTSLPFILPENNTLPEKPKWSTLFIAAGKKDKINKIDIVGFLSNKGNLKKDEIGLIEVKDFSSFVAIRKSKIGQVLEAIKEEKIKNKKVKMAIAK